MGISSRIRDIRPPLPAPTETDDDGGTSGPDTDVGTTLTTRTDKSAYEIPEDGSPIIIATQKLAGKKEGRYSGHQRDKSQTSLLIEYFEASNTGDKSKSRPSVRVKVSQGSKKRSASGNDAVKISTGIGADRQPSYTRRISLGSSRYAEVGADRSARHSYGSYKSPFEAEIFNHNESEISTQSRGLIYNPVESNVSSMPGDSMIEDNTAAEYGHSPSPELGYDMPTKYDGLLQKPVESRSRSASKERIAQKVMEKLSQRGALPSKSRSDRSLSREYDQEYTRGSDVSNNPKLVATVEDTIKNIILPELRSVREEQRRPRTPRSAEGSRRGSQLDDGLMRRVSKSSSTPNITNKPRVVLNRDGDDPGTTLSRGDSERKMRKTSQGSHSEERPRSKRSNVSLRDAGAASLGAGILTAAALKQHDHEADGYKRRKRRSKSRGSRSRSTGATETGDYRSKEVVPPLPMASPINESEMTRESLVSSGTERARSRVDAEARTPVREVSHGSLGDSITSPKSSRTPTRTPVTKDLGTSREPSRTSTPKTSTSAVSTKERKDIYNRHVDADGYGDSPTSQRKISSPVQSVSSLKKNFEEDTSASKELRPHSAASRSSAGQSREKGASRSSRRSGTSSPLALQRDAGEVEYANSPETPSGGDDMDDWYERQHRVNDRYRQSFGEDSPNEKSFEGTTNRDSYQTNPFPQDEKRWTMFSDDSPIEPTSAEDQPMRGVGAIPRYIHRPYNGAQSAVASLMDQSMASSGSPTKASYSDRMSANLREMGKDSPPMYQGSTLSQNMPSQDRWNAIKTQARQVSATNSVDEVDVLASPQQSPPKSATRELDAEPDVRYLDDAGSDVTTNPSIVKGPLGGDATGKDTWPYTSDRGSPLQRDLSSVDSASVKSGHSKGGMIAAAAAGATALAAAGYSGQADRSLTPELNRGGIAGAKQARVPSPTAMAREKHSVSPYARSDGSLTPEARQHSYSRSDIEEFNRAMDAQDVDDEYGRALDKDLKRSRHISGNSHGMSSPLYDSATGKGRQHIQSKDIVALMDHLTARDALRNARETEIITSLVRSSAEMRQSFDEMRRFIAEQDRKIMQSADRSAESTAQKVLSGPRPIPSRSVTDSRVQSEEDIQKKRKNVLRRALEGLKGGKSENDLARVENMLVEILQNVESLKVPGASRQESLNSYDNSGSGNHEHMRGASGIRYEPEVRADSADSSTPPGYFPPAMRSDKRFHSGYDGRRGSMNRVSTVLEDDEDDLEPHEMRALDDFETTDPLLTPTQEAYYGRRGISPNVAGSPDMASPQRNSGFGNGQEDLTPRSADKQRKHQSNSSSLFGVPKISRWSKTTTSSTGPDPATLGSPNIPQENQRALSEDSRSRSSLAQSQADAYELDEDDRLRSTQSLVREQQAAETRSVGSRASKLSRTPSPLIPSEVSYRSDEGYERARQGSPLQEDAEADFDDPKYQAVRNSLLLQHPQPRQGTTPRHQNTLESQAYGYEDVTGTNSDLSQKTTSDYDPAMWGSAGTAALAKSRLSQFEPLTPTSMNSPAGYAGSKAVKTSAPLVPLRKPVEPPKLRYEEPEPEPEPEWEPQYSKSGFSRGAYYTSPYGSGHLLEPIQEVRYSLETDSGHMSPEPEIKAAKAVDMRTRKISGPRPMGTRLSSAEQPRVVETGGTVRRKPVGAH